MKLTKDAKKLLKARYCKEGEKPEDVFERVAYHIGNNKNQRKQFQKIMEEREFLPNSPTIRNAGRNKHCLSACFVLPIHDNMESIFKTLKDSGIIFKHGGGVGMNWSEIRPKGSSLSGGGHASGVVSFMRMFDAMTNAVKQGGFRRGAQMNILNIDHPEIVDFVKEKIENRTLTNSNLSVRVTDEHMKQIEEDGYIRFRDPKTKQFKGGIRASTIFQLITMGAWMNGDPGLQFHDRINEDNTEEDNPIIASNPCGEENMHSYESCTLGSINLSKCVTKKGNLSKRKLKELIELGTQFLLNVNKKNYFPVPECKTALKKYNRIGLGVMGFADMLCKMGIYYDSKATLKVIKEIGKMLQLAQSIAIESASVLTVAPTGSISILASCSSGIEPFFSRNYVRKLSDDIGEIKEKRYSKYIRAAHEVSPEWHLKIQAEFQKWIDNSISKTINLPNDADIDTIKDIYIKAHKWGCKGITVFRDGSKGEQVYSKCEGDSCYL